MTNHYTPRERRARWRGNTTYPAFGSLGYAWPAPGHNDPRSTEYGAWMFTQDGAPEDRHGAYCNPDRDLAFLD